MADDTVEAAKAELFTVIEQARFWPRETLKANYDAAVDALIAAVRAEQSPAIREALMVECTCRVIEKCLRCEAIDATLPS